MTEIHILNFPEDSDECLDVIRHSFITITEDFGITRENTPTNPAFLSKDRFTEHLENDVILFGLFDEKQMAGCIAIEAAPNEEGVFYLERLAVLPEYRHRGYGKTLVDRAFEYAGERNGTTVSIAIIDEHELLKSWYMDYGFEISGRKNFSHLPFNVCFLKKSVEK